MVDTVLQFEGDHHYAYRILRAMKNRFGSTNEIGIFEMHDAGLREVENPSQVFLAERRYGTSGSTVVAGMEGTRPLLVEVQALVAPTSYGVPQRSATGFDARRLQMLLAVLEKRAGFRVGQYDVFVNVAGGIRVDEPAADLGMAVAIVSSLQDHSRQTRRLSSSARWGSAAKSGPSIRWRNGSSKAGKARLHALRPAEAQRRRARRRRRTAWTWSRWRASTRRPAAMLGGVSDDRTRTLLKAGTILTMDAELRVLTRRRPSSTRQEESQRF